MINLKRCQVMECPAEDNIGEPCVCGCLLYHRFCGWTRLDIHVHSCVPAIRLTTVFPCILLAPSSSCLFLPSHTAFATRACSRCRWCATQGKDRGTMGHRDIGWSLLLFGSGCLGSLSPSFPNFNVPSVRLCMYITEMCSPTMLQ